MPLLRNVFTSFVLRSNDVFKMFKKPYMNKGAGVNLVLEKFA